jgi:dTDP-4-amino-4,6-dideoxygalactose transaminase
MATRRRVAYLESKRPNRRRVASFLQWSKQSNHWANGGPVSRRLESAIAKLTALSPERAVIVCSSGTTALNALAGLHAVERGRPLRWAVSGYTFFSSFIGPFTGSIAVDCDERGMLDLDALSALPRDTYDGVCVTNLFGLYPDLGRYERFCRDRQKALIIDNAQGLFHVDRSRADCPDEIVSFHHTKSWGFGEGGCIIVSREDEATIRALIDFGVSLAEPARRFACNGKMADIAAAYILDRLEGMPDWLPRYERQWHRIAAALCDAHPGLKPFLPGAAPFTGVGHIPFVASRPVDLRELENDYFVMRKYYAPPAEPGLGAARGLFARIINIPCHSGMRTVPTRSLRQVLRGVLARL